MYHLDVTALCPVDSYFTRIRIRQRNVRSNVDANVDLCLFLITMICAVRCDGESQRADANQMAICVCVFVTHTCSCMCACPGAAQPLGHLASPSCDVTHSHKHAIVCRRNI